MDHLQERISQWKKEYDDIYQVTISDKDGEFSYTFIYRNIGRKEYNDLILQQLPKSVLEEKVCATCLLHPTYDFSVGLAGVAEILSDFIIESSYLMAGQSEQILMTYREEMQHLDYQVECIIHEAFPYLSIEEISNWTMQKTMYYLSRAEWTLTQLRGVPLQYVGDENAQQEQTQEFQHEFTSNAAPPPMAAPTQELSTEPGPNGELSEAELMAMLAENEAKEGRQINLQENVKDGFYPELGWFKDDEVIKGEFD